MWTKTIPTGAGAYWWKPRKNVKPQVVQMKTGYYVAGVYATGGDFVDDIPANLRGWWSRIEEPEGEE